MSLALHEDIIPIADSQHHTAVLEHAAHLTQHNCVLFVLAGYQSCKAAVAALPASSGGRHPWLPSPLDS